MVWDPIIQQGSDESVSHYIRRFNETKELCSNLSISDMDLADICLKGLRSSTRDRIEGSDFLSIAQVQIIALIVELRMTKENKNDSDLSNSSVIMTTEPNNIHSESVTSKESSLAVEEHINQKNTAILDLSKAEGVVHFSSDYHVIKRQVLAEKD